MKKITVLIVLLVLVTVGVMCVFVYARPQARVQRTAVLPATTSTPSAYVDFDSGTEEAYVVFATPHGDQTMSLTEPANMYYKESSSRERVLVYADVNFDGRQDVGVLTSIGYGGVNLFYTYYALNAQSGRYEEIVGLGEVPNEVDLDLANRTMTTRMESVGSWVEVQIIFDGERYTRTTKDPIRDWE